MCHVAGISGRRFGYLAGQPDTGVNLLFTMRLIGFVHDDLAQQHS